MKKEKRRWLNHTEGLVVLSTVLVGAAPLDKWALALVPSVFALGLPSVPGAGCLSNSPAWPQPGACQLVQAASCLCHLPWAAGVGGRGRLPWGPLAGREKGIPGCARKIPCRHRPRTLSLPKEGAGTAWWRSERKAGTESCGQSYWTSHFLSAPLVL